MDYREKIRKNQEQTEKMKRRIIGISIVLCVLWIPIALLIYWPSLVTTGTP